MPNIKSAKKRVLVNEANRLENKKVRKAYRDAVKAFEAAVANGDKNLEELQLELQKLKDQDRSGFVKDYSIH